MSRLFTAACIFTAVCAFSGTANAGLMEVNFSDGSNSGTFVYDSDELTNGTGAPYGQSGVSYDAISFTVNSVAQTGPFYVEIFNDFSNGYDIVYFTAEAGGTSTDPNRVLQLACDNCLADSSLTQLTGMSLTNFTSNATSPDVNNFYPNGYDAFDGGNNLVSLSIQAVPGQPIPEPSIIALFGLGLLGLGFARRRKGLS